jgi:hypothetical protein
MVVTVGAEDWRRAESGINAGEPIVGFDADQGGIALNLGSKVR